MHARVITVEITPDRFDESMAIVTSHALQRVRNAPNCMGAYWFGDRSRNLALAVVFLNTDDPLHASHDYRQRLGDVVGSAPDTRVTGDAVYEVVAQIGPRVSRTAQFCRTIMWQEDPRCIVPAIRRIHQNVIPGVQQNAGFQGGFWLVDRQTGCCLGMTLWDTVANLQISGTVGRQMREEPVRRGDMHILSLRNYEVIARVERT